MHPMLESADTHMYAYNIIISSIIVAGPSPLVHRVSGNAYIVFDACYGYLPLRLWILT